eukprot:scaffold133683_cov115-Phaeocystis_antarctica.AAC.1
MRAVEQSRIYFSRRMGSRRPSSGVPGSHPAIPFIYGFRRSGKLSVQKRSKAVGPKVPHFSPTRPQQY